MAEGRSLTTISETDYETIEAAVMETERGRWFLKEYARRNRTADTQVLLEAIGRLEQAVAGDRVAQDVERLRTNLREMATAITRTKTEIASIHAVEQEHSRLFVASRSARRDQPADGTGDLRHLAAAEHIQEIGMDAAGGRSQSGAVRRPRSAGDGDLHGVLVPGHHRPAHRARSSRRCAISKAASTR